MDVKKLASSKCFGGEVTVHQFASATCGTNMRFSIYLPPQSETKNVPAIFFLSGLTCTEENFMVKAGAQRTAANLGLAIVVPDTSPREARVPGDDSNWDLGLGAGFYVDATEDPWAPNYRMASFVGRELPNVIAANFPVDSSRFGIMGHSMGGHGAIVTALRNQTKFKSCSAFAPISAPTQCPWGQKAFGAYLGSDTKSWREWDSCELLQDQGPATEESKKIPILVDQGDLDPWLDQLRPDLLAKAAEKANWPVTLRMQAGYDHSYYFIASFIEDHLHHHARHLTNAP